MPRAWSSKRERQYEKIERSAKQRGASERRAEEIAARTVNKQRRQAGETPNQKTEGTGNPNLPLEQRSRDELYNRAQQLGIEGRSKMKKSQLLRAVRKAS